MGKATDFGVNESTRPEEAVKLAMERERLAREFYLRCASIVVDPGVKKMFEFLAKEESRHFELLEKEYDRFIAGEN
jgi:rubrerythrin